MALYQATIHPFAMEDKPMLSGMPMVGLRPGWVALVLGVALGMGLLVGPQRAMGGDGVWAPFDTRVEGDTPGFPPVMPPNLPPPNLPPSEVPVPGNPNPPLLPGPANPTNTPPSSEGNEAGIFGRLDSSRAFREREQIMVGSSFWAQPVAMSDARVTENQGIRYAHSFRPRAMVYGGWAWEMNSTHWVPKDPSIAEIQVFQLAYENSLNFWLRRVAVMRIGLGLGLMSGLVRYNDARVFQTRLEPYIPISLGLGFYITDSTMVEWSGSLSPFFGPGPVMNLWRQGVSVGFNF